MGVAHHLRTIGGIISVTTNYWMENLHLSLDVLHMNLNGIEWLVEMDLKRKNFEKDKKRLVLFLKYSWKIPVE